MNGWFPNDFNLRTVRPFDKLRPGSELSRRTPDNFSAACECPVIQVRWRTVVMISSYLPRKLAELSIAFLLWWRPAAVMET